MIASEDMTHEEWLEYAKEHLVTDIGQLEARTKRALDREVKAGRLAKYRDRWLGSLGAVRSHWHPTWPANKQG